VLRTEVLIDVALLDARDRRALLADVRSWPGVAWAELERGTIVAKFSRRSDADLARARAREAVDSGSQAFWDRQYRSNGMAWFSDPDYLGEGGTVAAVAGTVLAKARAGKVRVLDVGCGPGALLRAMATTPGALGASRVPGLVYHGFDLSAEAVALGIRGMAGSSHPFPWWMSVCEPGCARAFDQVVAMHVLEHVPDPGRFVAGLWGHVAPGGALVLAGRLLEDAPVQHPKYRQNRFVVDGLRDLVVGSAPWPAGVARIDMLGGGNAIVVGAPL
jgi:SAM-dependent methyltransferase